MSTVTMFHDLGLPDAADKALDRKAKGTNTTARDDVRTRIEADLEADKPFDEILFPIRDGFRASGLNQRQLSRLFTKARQNLRQ